MRVPLLLILEEEGEEEAGPVTAEALGRDLTGALVTLLVSAAARGTDTDTADS